MAEIVVENQICEACGADIRPGSLFCYNCGGALDGQIEKIENKNGNNKTNDARREAIAEKEFVEKARIETIENAKIKDKKPDLVQEAKLKSAASMRRKAKSFQTKEVEVIWEEPENVSGVRLILIALLLTAFAAAVVIFAMYLK